MALGYLVSESLATARRSDWSPGPCRWGINVYSAGAIFLSCPVPSQVDVLIKNLFALFLEENSCSGLIKISQKAAVLAPALQIVAVVAVCLGGCGTPVEELAGLHATVSIASFLGAAWHGLFWCHENHTQLFLQFSFFFLYFSLSFNICIGIN